MVEFNITGNAKTDLVAIAKILKRINLKHKKSEKNVSDQIDHILSHLLDLKVSINSNKFSIDPTSKIFDRDPKPKLRFEPVEKLYKNPYSPQSVLDEYVAEHNIDENSSDKELYDFLNFYESNKHCFNKWDKSSKKTPEERNREVYHDKTKCETEGHIFVKIENEYLVFMCHICKDDNKKIKTKFAECKECRAYLTTKGYIIKEYKNRLYTCDDCIEKYNNEYHRLSDIE